YYNASDSSASAGAYHYIHKTKSELGGGALLFYNLNETFGFFAGYNSLREGTLGLEIRFLKEKQY
ncbi:MAG TPA: hypothetical protein VFD24_08590, partial [Chitinophagaceae bacterium]|nr:hypothetical protein [Chitinophagaceae bacterium]